jgi:hypothetical protein
VLQRLQNIIITITAASFLFTLPCFAVDNATAGSAIKTKEASKAPEKAPAASKKNDTLVITARLVEIPGKFAPNDLYNYVYVMKYRILKVEKGTYTEKEILVGQYNPLIPRKNIKDKMASCVSGDADKFEVGVKHTMVLVTPLESLWKDATEDEYFDSPLKKYFALRTDNAK